MLEEAVGLDAVSSSDKCVVRFGREHEHLDRFLKDVQDLDEDTRAQIFGSAVEALGQCSNPLSANGRTTGLVLGKVQSGKTTQFISCMALAIDSGFRIIVLFGGRTNALLDQNHERLYEYFDLAHRPDELAPFKNPSSTDLNEMSAILMSGNTVVINVLKQQERLGQLKELLQSPELRHYPVLIVDDEADQASMNTQAKRGKQSAIYARITELRDALRNHAYLATTATPQANLLIKTWDHLSPEFCVMVEPGAGYCGGATFFGPERDALLREVDEHEDPTQDGVPDGLRSAFAVFLGGAAVRTLRHDRKPHSMLVHTSGRRDRHLVVTTKVQGLLTLWKGALELPPSDPAASDVLKYLGNAYKDLATTVHDLPSWDEFLAQVRQEIQLTKVSMVNSLPQGINPTTTPIRLKNSVLVGGNMLDRGVTIKGLAVTYITRSARVQQADTVEQRARWFGYKLGFLDVSRLFATEAILNVFTELSRHEEDFWESLRRNREQGIPLKEWPRLFRLGLNIKPTRSNVALVRTFRGDGWHIQRVVETDPACYGANRQLMRRALLGRGEQRRFGNVTHTVIADYPVQDVIDDVLTRYQISDTSDWDKEYVNEYMQRLVVLQRLETIPVILMSNGKERDRTPTNGRINPMQGQSPDRAPDDPEFYPGDEHLMDDYVHLQVHNIRLTEKRGVPTGKSTIALALHVPKREQYDLGRMVVPSD